MIPDLTYNAAIAHIESSLIQGRLLKADVHIIRFGGRKYVLKDYTAKGFWVRNIAGRIVTGLETRAYRALVGIDGLPSQFKRLSPFALAIEYLEGRDLGVIQPAELGPGILLQFERIIEDLHERGWVHLDLQKRSNIIVADAKLYFVDLGSAFHAAGVPLIGKCLMRVLSFFDRLSLIKHKSFYAPELLSPQEKKWLRLRNKVMPRKW